MAINLFFIIKINAIKIEIVINHIVLGCSTCGSTVWLHFFKNWSNSVRPKWCTVPAPSLAPWRWGWAWPASKKHNGADDGAYLFFGFVCFDKAGGIFNELLLFFQSTDPVERPTSDQIFNAGWLRSSMRTTEEFGLSSGNWG